MPVLHHHDESVTLGERLRNAHAVTRALMLDVIAAACRIHSLGQSELKTRLTRLIDAEAWTDAALALIELDLPFWQVRRIAYDDGEWYCALSRARELPDWLDDSVETRHADLALTLLSAFVEARALTAGAARPSVPLVQPALDSLCEPIGCDSFA